MRRKSHQLREYLQGTLQDSEGWPGAERDTSRAPALPSLRSVRPRPPGSTARIGNGPHLRGTAGLSRLCLLLAMTLSGCAKQPAESPSNDAAASAAAPAPTHGFLGLTFQSIEEWPLTIAGTVPSSGAEEAGIAKDDLLISVDRISKPNMQQIYEVVLQTTPGDMLQIGVRRGEQELSLQVRLISHEDVQNAMDATLNEK